MLTLMIVKIKGSMMGCLLNPLMLNNKTEMIANHNLLLVILSQFWIKKTWTKTLLAPELTKTTDLNGIEKSHNVTRVTK